LFAAVQAGADVAMGSVGCERTADERQPLYRQLFGRIFNLALRILLLALPGHAVRIQAFTRRAANPSFRCNTSSAGI